MTHPIFWHELIGIPAPYGTTFYSTLVMLALIGFAIVANRRLVAAQASGEALVPDESLSIRNLAELLVGGISGLAHGVIGPRAKPVVGVFGTFFVFILINNATGLLPGFAPATSNFNITFALGVGSFLAFNYIGIKDQGLRSYIAHFAGPVWWLAILMFPLEIIGVFVRPVSLGLRLFGNMTGDHLVLEIFTDLTKVVIPVIFYFFGTLVSVLQAFVFTLLTIIYVSLSMGHGDHH
jgi:F-type H+-transporting ATPase subunit a